MADEMIGGEKFTLLCKEGIVKLSAALARHCGLEGFWKEIKGGRK